MPLSRTDTICHVPADRMRAVVRALSGQPTFITAGRLVLELDVEDGDARATLEAMLDEQLVSPAPPEALMWGPQNGLVDDAYDLEAPFVDLPGCDPAPDDAGRPVVWLRAGAEATQLAGKNFRKAITRATGVTALNELVAHAAEVNNDDDLAFYVGEVVLFGSLLDPDRDRLGDVDVAVSLVPRYEGERQQQAEAERMRFCTRNISYVDQLEWARTEIYRRLRGKRRCLSLVDLDVHRDWLSQKPHRTVFAYAV